MKKYLVLFILAMAVSATGALIGENAQQPEASSEAAECIPCGGKN